jgi:RNA polymerase sigma-32 factor
MAPATMVHSSSDVGYVAAIARRAPILQRDLEIELTRRFRDARDPHAADVLVRAHLRMVVALALKYRNHGIPLGDLIGEGNFGLVMALERFDPERGVRFGTYAKHWVRSRILGCLVSSLAMRDGAAGVVKPRLFFRLRRERARIAALLGDGAHVDEALAERLNVSVERARQLSDCVEYRHFSLDASGQGSRDWAGEALTTHDEDPEQRYIHGHSAKAASSALASAIKVLDKRERFIAEHRLLAPATAGLSLTQISKAWGISRERVRQLEERAKRKLGRSAAIKGNSSLHELLAD